MYRGKDVLAEFRQSGSTWKRITSKDVPYSNQWQLIIGIYLPNDCVHAEIGYAVDTEEFLDINGYSEYEHIYYRDSPRSIESLLAESLQVPSASDLSLPGNSISKLDAIAYDHTPVSINDMVRVDIPPILGITGNIEVRLTYEDGTSCYYSGCLEHFDVLIATVPESIRQRVGKRVILHSYYPSDPSGSNAYSEVLKATSLKRLNSKLRINPLRNIGWHMLALTASILDVDLY